MIYSRSVSESVTMSETREPLTAKLIAREADCERVAWPLGGMIILVLSLAGWGIFLIIMQLLLS